MYRSGIVALSVAGVSLLGACGGGGGPVTPAPAAPQISSLTISPQSVFVAAGTTEQLSATATLTDGSTTPETPVWSSSSSSIADVSTLDTRQESARILGALNSAMSEHYRQEIARRTRDSRSAH
jgi:hypothetical protein